MGIKLDDSSDAELAALANAIAGTTDDTKKAEGLYSKEDMAKLIKLYIEETIPDELKDDELYTKFWAITGKSPILTFLESGDEEDFDSFFRISKLRHMMGRPQYANTFSQSQHINQLRIYFRCAIKRAMGFEGSKNNERTMQATSINQTVRSNTEGIAMPSKQGFFRRMAGGF